MLIHGPQFVYLVFGIKTKKPFKQPPSTAGATPLVISLLAVPGLVSCWAILRYYQRSYAL
jgi:hypothetical protein